MAETRSQRTEVAVIACRDAESIAACYDVMHELRDGLDRAGYEERAAAARDQGYRLARAEDQGQVVGVIGYRLWNDLVFGRSLFVDDLVVAAVRRGGGIGQALCWPTQRRRHGAKAVRRCASTPASGARTRIVSMKPSACTSAALPSSKRWRFRSGG